MKVPPHSKLYIVCPNPATVLTEQGSSIPREQLYENMWIVDKYEYDACRVNTSMSTFLSNRNLLRCDTPFELKYFEMVFRPNSMWGLEFQPGRRYCFIGNNYSLQVIYSYTKYHKTSDISVINNYRLYNSTSSTNFHFVLISL